MKKHPEITEQTRANLLQAFWSLYEKKPLDQITVKEIAAKAGYNRGTFYEYFTDRYDCLHQIEALALPTLEELPPIPRGTEQSIELFQSFISLYQDRFAYYDRLLGDQGDPSFQRKLIDSIKTSITSRTNQTQTINSLELDLMLEFILSGMIGILRYYFHSNPQGSPAEVMALVYRFMDGEWIEKLSKALVG